MEEAGAEETKTRRYGLRSRGNVNKPPGEEGGRVTGGTTRQVLKDDTARVVNVAKTKSTARKKTKTGPRKEVEAVVQETTEKTVAVDSVVEAESSENIPPPFDRKVEERAS